MTKMASRYRINEMDCPSEESLIRIKMAELGEVVAHLAFDLDKRELEVIHEGETAKITEKLASLGLGETLLASHPTQKKIEKTEGNQRKVLWIILGINFAFFVFEMLGGWLFGSMGLIADSLDMLADSFVYAISLMVVGGTIVRKKQIARLAGYFQILLACLGFFEVIRRFFFSDRLPDFQTMMILSFFALIANAYCLYLLQRSKGKEEAHMQASLIFTSNDIIINFGVIVAGILVLLLNSAWPDLIIGGLVFLLVLKGAQRILAIAR
ncbi:MAG: cation transporter [Cyclobacteriaceae bacterium]|nr:cation transporter [Cyclobacteriaceae bacterium]MCH8515740.1 cation transporter [Cyclobacteriaceae bacterium]